jgi:hypothetical protein
MTPAPDRTNDRPKSLVANLALEMIQILHSEF